MSKINKTGGLEFSATRESTKGVVEAVSPTDFIKAIDTITANNPKDKVETPVMGGSRLEKESVKTIQRGDGQVNTYVRAGEAEGDTPETDILLRSQGWTPEPLASRITTTGVNTVNMLKVDSGDDLLVKVGQCIVIEDSTNGDHAAFITATADTEIHYAPAASVIPVTGAQIKKSQNYRLDGLEDESFTARKWFARVQNQEIPYCKVSTMAVGPFSVGKTVPFDFTYAGINFVENLAQDLTGVNAPDYQNTTKPFAIKACLYQDGVALDATEVSFSFENALTANETLCADNGVESQVANGMINISGSFNVFKSKLTSEFNPSDTKYSLFISISVKSGDDLVNVVSFHIPACKTDERDTNGDVAGSVSQTVTFTAEPTANEEDFPTIMFS